MCAAIVFASCAAIANAQTPPVASRFAAPPGRRFQTPAQICEHLSHLRQVWEGGVEGSARDPFLPEGGVLRVPMQTSEAACMALPWDFFEESCAGFACDASMTRCTSGGTVYLLRRGERGLYLFAIVAYGDAAPVREPARISGVLARRDRVCELFEMVHARDPRIDPRGYVREDTWNMEEGRRPPRLCGEIAHAGAMRDIAAFDTGHLECTQSDCIRNLASNHAELMGKLLAHRAPDGTLLLYAHSAYETEYSPLRILERNPCPTP